MEDKETRMADEVAPTTDGWVAPEVAAAEAGEQVEFGKDLAETDEEENDS